MHRHGYKGRKFGRERDQRKALIKQLVSSLIERGKIETTLPKAKEIVPVIEKLITKAKQGDLAGRRQVIAGVTTLPVAFKLVDEIAPQLSKRTSGHVRLNKTRLRRGDNAEMAEVSFVDPLTANAPAASGRAKNKTPVKAVKKNNETAAKPSLKASRSSTSAALIKQATVAPKRTGRRGDR